MDNYEEIVRKVTKLLKLSQSSNVNEAASAAAKAQDLMDRYQLNRAMLSTVELDQEGPQEDIKAFWDEPIVEGKRRSQWKQRLASTIARANACRIYLSGGSVLIVGRPTDVGAVRYLYGWLEREIDRLAKWQTGGYGKSYASEYRLGAVEAVGEQIRQQRKKTFDAAKMEAKNPYALQRVETAITKIEQRSTEVVNWMGTNMHLGTGRGFSSRSYDGRARERGRADANKHIKVNRARGGLTKGQDRLEG